MFALALLIHVGLFALLVSDRPARVASFERQTTLVLLPGPRAKSRAVQIEPPAPPRLPEHDWKDD